MLLPLPADAGRWRVVLVPDSATRAPETKGRRPESLRLALAGCGKSRFGSKLGVFLVTQNHHPRPISRSWGNCVRFVFRIFLPKRFFPQPARPPRGFRFSAMIVRSTENVHGDTYT